MSAMRPRGLFSFELGCVYVGHVGKHRPQCMHCCSTEIIQMIKLGHQIAADTLRVASRRAVAFCRLKVEFCFPNGQQIPMDLS